MSSFAPFFFFLLPWPRLQRNSKILKQFEWECYTVVCIIGMTGQYKCKATWTIRSRQPTVRQMLMYSSHHRIYSREVQYVLKKRKRCWIGLISREMATQHPKGKEHGEVKMVKNKELSCLKPLEITGWDDPTEGMPQLQGAVMGGPGDRVRALPELLNWI